MRLVVPFRLTWKREDLCLMAIMFFGQCIFLFPDGLSHLSLYRYIRLTQTGLSLAAAAWLVIRHLNDRYIRANLLFFIILAAATFRIDTSVDSLLLYISRSIGIITLYYCISRINYELFWREASRFFSIIALINTILTLLRPNGLFTDISANNITVSYYLLGNVNQIIPFYIIGATASIVHYQLSGQNKLRGLMIFLQALLCDLIYGSMTSMIMLFVFAVLYFVLYKQRLISRKRRGIAFASLLFVFAWYYGLLVLNAQVLFKSVIENVLHKDVTLSTRITIWKQAFELIGKSPLLGYGASTRRLLVFGSHTFDSHNLVLQILLMGGILLFLALIAIIILAFKSWVKCGDKTRIAPLILFISFAIGSSTEVFVFTYVFIVPLFVYLVGRYGKGKEKAYA